MLKYLYMLNNSFNTYAGGGSPTLSTYAGGGSPTLSTGVSIITSTCGAIGYTGSGNPPAAFSGNYYFLKKKEITIFDKKFTIDTGNDILIILAQLDFLGIGFYESLKNMNLHNVIPSEVCSFLEAELKRFKRSEKIKKALTKNDKS